MAWLWRCPITSKCAASRRAMQARRLGHLHDRSDRPAAVSHLISTHPISGRIAWCWGRTLAWARGEAILPAGSLTATHQATREGDEDEKELRSNAPSHSPKRFAGRVSCAVDISS